MTHPTMTTTREVHGPKITAGTLRGLIEGVPDETEVDVHVSAGDRPWESGTTTISVTIEQEQR